MKIERSVMSQAHNTKWGCIAIGATDAGASGIEQSSLVGDPGPRVSLVELLPILHCVLFPEDCHVVTRNTAARNRSCTC